jgi:hypothetical protein
VAVPDLIRMLLDDINQPATPFSIRILNLGDGGCR